LEAAAEPNELGIFGDSNITLKTATYQQLGFFPITLYDNVKVTTFMRLSLEDDKMSFEGLSVRRRVFM
jgi:hypothetical protein